MSDTQEEPKDLIRWEGFDEAIVGIVRRCASPDLLCYSWEKMIEVLCKKGSTPEDAAEYLYFNVLGAWVGDLTPVVLFPKEEGLSLEEFLEEVR